MAACEEDGSNCPAKYTSWPCLAPSSSSAAGVVVALYQWRAPRHPRSIARTFPEHLCSIPAAPRSTETDQEGSPFIAIPIAMVNGHIYPITVHTVTICRNLIFNYGPFFFHTEVLHRN